MGIPPLVNRVSQVGCPVKLETEGGNWKEDIQMMAEILHQLIDSLFMFNVIIYGFYIPGG